MRRDYNLVFQCGISKGCVSTMTDTRVLCGTLAERCRSNGAPYIGGVPFQLMNYVCDVSIIKEYSAREGTLSTFPDRDPLAPPSSHSYVHVRDMDNERRHS